MKIGGSGPKGPIESGEKAVKKEPLVEKAKTSIPKDSSRLSLSQSLKAMEELSKAQPESYIKAQRSPDRQTVDLLLNQLDSGSGRFSRVDSTPQQREAALSFLEGSAKESPFSFVEAFSDLDASRVAKLLED